MENQLIKNKIYVSSKKGDISAYRLADAIILKNNALPAVLKVHKDSIAFNYLLGRLNYFVRVFYQLKLLPYILIKHLLRRDYVVSIKLLKNLVCEYCKINNYSSTPSKTIILHLRLGDMIEKLENKGESLEKDLQEIFENIESIALQKNIDKVIIVTALHLKSLRVQDNSFNYLDRVIEFLDNKKMKYELKSSNNPDEDFCFLVNAENLICTYGGFSLLAYLCNSNNKYILKSNNKNIYQSKNSRIIFKEAVSF